MVHLSKASCCSEGQGRRPAVVLPGRAEDAPDQLEAQDKAWVFPSPEARPTARPRSRGVPQGARGAGLKDFHFHDLRHHGATMALNRGSRRPS